MSPLHAQAPEVIDLDETAVAWVTELPPLSRHGLPLVAVGAALSLPLLTMAYRGGAIGLADAVWLTLGLLVVIVAGHLVLRRLARHHVGTWQRAAHPAGGVAEELIEAVSGTLADHGMILLRLKPVHPLTGPSRVLAAGADGQEVYYRFTLDPGADLRLHREDWDAA